MIIHEYILTISESQSLSQQKQNYYRSTIIQQNLMKTTYTSIEQPQQPNNHQNENQTQQILASAGRKQWGMGARGAGIMGQDEGGKGGGGFLWICWNVLVFVLLLAVGNYVLYQYYYMPAMEEAEKYDQSFKNIQRQISRIDKIDPNYGQIQRPEQNIINPPKLPQKNLTLVNLTNFQQIQQYSDGIADNFQFSRYLFSNWLTPNPLIDPAQYYRFNKTYNLDQQVPQKRICIMAPFRNLLKYGTQYGSFHIFLQSINAQNYTNYHVYMIDDASTDNSSDVILKQLVKYPRLNNRITILKNQYQVGALGNRDSTTRKYCRAGDIVMDVDGDDALIGKQVFNFINRLYFNNQDAWFIYTNFIQIKGDTEGDGRHISINLKKSQKGICAKIKQYVHRRNSYRTELDWWMTSQLRTYLWDLYIKIPLTYVIEKSTGKYYFEASDRFTMYALVQLAGINHTFHYPEFNYFYYQPNFDAWRVQTKSCTIKVLFYCEAQARILTPLLPLASLSDPALETPNYTLPTKIVKYFLSAQFQLFQCLKQKWGVHSAEF